MKCCLCKKEIKKNEKYNYFMCEYSHDICDGNLHKKIDSKIKYL